MATRRRSSSTAGLQSYTDDAQRGRDVLLERIESQMQFVIEAVTGMREDFDVKLTALEQRLSERIRILEDVVRMHSEQLQKNTAAIQKNSEDIQKNSEDIRKNSEDIRKNSEDIRKNSEQIQKNTEDIQRLRLEVAGLRHDFERRQEPGEIQALEKRVSRIERKVGMGRGSSS